jgi:hypothetical protein
LLLKCNEALLQAGEDTLGLRQIQADGIEIPGRCDFVKFDKITVSTAAPGTRLHQPQCPAYPLFSIATIMPQ